MLQFTSNGLRALEESIFLILCCLARSVLVYVSKLCVQDLSASFACEYQICSFQHVFTMRGVRGCPHAIAEVGLFFVRHGLKKSARFDLAAFPAGVPQILAGAWAHRMQFCLDLSVGDRGNEESFRFAAHHAVGYVETWEFLGVVEMLRGHRQGRNAYSRCGTYLRCERKTCARMP